MKNNITARSSALDKQAAWIRRYQPALRLTEQGHVASVGDGIAWITGLQSARMEDILVFEDGSQALVFDLTEEILGAILLSETDSLTAGMVVHLTAHELSIPVDEAMLGRILTPLGLPLDGTPRSDPVKWQPLEARAPAIIARDFVSKPLYTGIKVIDTLIPIGKGQRQLLISDEGLGRSSLALDSVINQKGKDVYCVYVLIGQKRSTILRTIETLREYGAMDYTTIIVAEASSLPGLQHLAPFAGCAIAEYWMHQGKDTLVVYDDLATHARTYRELSLLLRRPPGREAYPGDIFSIHARLLERATCLNAEHGGGSMTAFPIAETQQGEIAAYIPTNLISITDGQIRLDQQLFASGFRPAVDIGKSVSRIGGQAQNPLIQHEAGRMKLDYLQYLELEVYTRFGAKLEASMEVAIKRGQILKEILKQNRLAPLSIEFNMAWMVAFNDNLFEIFNVKDIPKVLDELDNQLGNSTLNLETPRQEWSQSISRWLSKLNNSNAPVKQP